MNFHVSKLLIAAFVAGVPTTVGVHADEIKATAKLCATYRLGPLVTERMAVYYEPMKDNPEAFNWVDIHYRYKYLIQPHFHSHPNGRPTIAERFEIDVESGQPLPMPAYKMGIKPSETTDFNMLIRGSSYQTPSRMIGILGGRSPLDLDFGHTENGKFILDPGPFNRTGEMFHGYERITVSGISERRKKRHELYVEENVAGKIIGVLYCNRLGTVSNPGCSLYEQMGMFDTQLRIRRYHMPLIKKIKHYARSFAKI